MAEQQFKRNVSYKLRIGDVLIAKPTNYGERFSHLELGNKKIVRVNIVGNIVDKYEYGNVSETENKKYIFLTLDDGSGQIKLKSFGDDSEKFRNFFQGQTIVVIGTVKYWNNEIYISPEIIKELDPKYLLLRKLETEQDKNLQFVPLEKEKVVAIKDKILDLIKNSEKEGGVELEEITQKFREVSPNLIQQEVQKLLEEGIAFEPRPGKIRWLG